MTAPIHKKLASKEVNIRNCVFGFRCEANWDAMELTNQDDVRFCDHCEKEVYFISSKSELLESINLNRCVAISTLIRSDNGMKLEHITSGVIEGYIEDK